MAKFLAGPPDFAMKRQLAALLFAWVGFAGPARAEVPPKIFLVDMARLLQSYYKTSEYALRWLGEEQKIRGNLDVLNKQRGALDDEYKLLQQQMQNSALSPAARALAQKEADSKMVLLTAKQKEIRAYTQESTNTLAALRQKDRASLLAEISVVASEIARSRRASLLIDKSSRSLLGGPLVLHSESGSDISDEVLEAINRPHAAKLGEKSSPAAGKTP